MTYAEIRKAVVAAVAAGLVAVISVLTTAVAEHRAMPGWPVLLAALGAGIVSALAAGKLVHVTPNADPPGKVALLKAGRMAAGRRAAPR